MNLTVVAFCGGVCWPLVSFEPTYCASVVVGTCERVKVVGCDSRVNEQHREARLWASLWGHALVLAVGWTASSKSEGPRFGNIPRN